MPASAQPFRPQGEGNIDRLQLRLAFLLAIESEAPSVVRQLERDVSPAYAQLSKRYGGAIDLSTVRQLARSLAEAEALRSALLTWSAEYHLDRDDWIAEAALRHLPRYDADSLERIQLGSIGSVFYWDPAAAIPGPPRYQADIETQAQFVARTRVYADAVEASYTHNGWSRGKVRLSVTAHAEWLVRFQVLGVTYTSVDPKADASSVRKAIKALAKFLPLALRTERA